MGQSQRSEAETQAATDSQAELRVIVTTWLQLALTKVVYLLEQKSLAKGAREARPFVDEAVLLHFALLWGNSWLLTRSVLNS